MLAFFQSLFISSFMALIIVSGVLYCWSFFNKSIRGRWIIRHAIEVFTLFGIVFVVWDYAIAPKISFPSMQAALRNYFDSNSIETADDGSNVAIAKASAFEGMSRAEAIAELSRKQEAAITLRDTEQFEVARDAFLSLQSDVTSYFGEVSAEHADLLSHFGSVYTIVGDYESRARIFEKAVELKQKLYGADSPRVADDLVNLASSYLGSNDFDKAENTLNEALGIFEKAGVRNDAYAVGIELLGIIEARKGFPKQALEQYLVALETLKQNGKTQTGNYADLLISIGYVQRDLGSCSEAKSSFEEARDIVQQNSSIFSNQHRDAAIAQIDMLSC